MSSFIVRRMAFFNSTLAKKVVGIDYESCCTEKWLVSYYDTYARSQQILFQPMLPILLPFSYISAAYSR